MWQCQARQKVDKVGSDDEGLIAQPIATHKRRCVLELGHSDEVRHDHKNSAISVAFDDFLGER